MSQTSIGTDLDTKYEGREAFPLTPKVNESKVVEETDGINFGRVVLLAADTDKARLPRSNQATIVLDADLVTSNSVACSVVINGTTTALTATVFATSHLVSMQAIDTKLEAVTGIASATVGGANNRTITIVFSPEYDGYVSVFTVTLGASQAVATLANTESGSFYGIAAQSAKQLTADGVSLYEDNETASVARVNYIDVYSDDALAIGDSVYVRFFEESAADKKRGMIMGSAGSSPVKAKIWSDVEVVSACAAGGLATLRINK
tara:strand:- start:309 stop:1097 length:789 start_codon:yes stop_codon:yes gene_type:complete